MNKKFSIDRSAQQIIYKLQTHGYVTYLVGGAVRDCLLDTKPKDFDISTTATPLEIKKLFGRNAIIIGKRFQIVHIRKGREIYEISTFRRTPSKEERKGRMTDDGVMVWRDNEFGSPEEDAQRRDFTVNALFMDTEKNNTIIDFCGGLDDLKKKIVRSIGKPEVRLLEDPVRILRAVKLEAQYGFTIEKNLKQAIIKLGTEIQKVSESRLYEEILKILRKPYSAKTFELCHQYGFLKYMLAGMAEMLDSDDAELYLKILLERDKKVAEGATLSRAYSLAMLCYRAVEKKLNAGSQFGDNWDFTAGMEKHCREEVGNFMKPFNITRFISSRVREVILLQYRMLNGKSPTKVLRHKEYYYARLLFITMSDYLGWQEHVEKWPLKEFDYTQTIDRPVYRERRKKRRHQKRKPSHE